MTQIEQNKLLIAAMATAIAIIRRHDLAGMIHRALVQGRREKFQVIEGGRP